jgi:hypothetical protein
MKSVYPSVHVSALNLCQDFKNDSRNKNDAGKSQKAELKSRTMTVGDVWDADQLMGKTPYKGYALDKTGKDSKGVVQPHCWGLPGFLSPSDYDCFGEFVPIIPLPYLAVL